MTLPLPTGPTRLILPAIVIWVLVPFTTGELIGEALSQADDPFRTTVSVTAWASWVVVLVAIAVARPVTLTLSRLGAVGALAAALWASIEVGGRDDADGVLILLGIGTAVLAVFALHLPGVGDRFVDGISYGDEKRFLLRAPGPVLIVALGPSVAIVVIGIAAGPLLLADERWIAGAVVTILGWLAAWFPLNALHRLTNRFLVFVPNGLVVHDPSVIREPVLFVTREIAGLAPAAPDTIATDFTSNALGLALELRLAAAAQIPVVTGRTETEEQTVRSLLVAPSRPGAVVTTALERGLPIA